MTPPTPFEVPAFAPVLPELVLAIASLALLMLGVFGGERANPRVARLAVAALLVAGFLVLRLGPERTVTFGGLVVVDAFAVFCKCLVLLGAAASLVISQAYLERERLARFEYPVLVLLATLGLMMMISANDVIALYLAVELASLALYVAAAIRRDDARSCEAGLKFFMLGALSSGLVLYGASLIYGVTGHTGFDRIAAGVAGAPTLGAAVGLVVMVAGLAVRLAAVPFHMWTPDVYEGAPTAVTALLAAAPIVAAIALLTRLLFAPFAGLGGIWQELIAVIAMASMGLGAIAAIAQTNIKRVMAYAAIGHVGYLMIGLAGGTETGLRGVLIYLAIYSVMTIGVFTIILCMRQQGRMVEDIHHLAGLSRTHPMMALAMTIFLFSMAGIPPFAGFFGKLYVFLAAIETGRLVLAMVGVVTTVVACYYYIRIVKLMYFDEPVDVFDRQNDRSIALVLVGTAGFTLFFFLFPMPLIGSARVAARSLFGG